MARRRKQGSAFSLFAFQDIITSVTGIMLLVTMMLALELVRRKEQSPPVQTEMTTDSLEEAVAANQREMEQLKSTLSADDKLIKYDEQTLQRKIDELKQVNSLIAKQAEEIEKRRRDAEERKKEADDSLSQTATPRQVQEEQQRLEDLKRELEQMRQSNRIIFNRPSGESKSPWLVEISANNLQVAEVGVSARPQSFADPFTMAEWAQDRSAQSMYFVMLVKPSGLSNFYQLRQELEDQGFEIGYDLLREDQQAIDSQTGAGVREESVQSE